MEQSEVQKTGALLIDTIQSYIERWDRFSKSERGKQVTPEYIRDSFLKECEQFLKGLQGKPEV